MREAETVKKSSEFVKGKKAKAEASYFNNQTKKRKETRKRRKKKRRDNNDRFDGYMYLYFLPLLKLSLYPFLVQINRRIDVFSKIKRGR